MNTGWSKKDKPALPDMGIMQSERSHMRRSTPIAVFLSLGLGGCAGSGAGVETTAPGDVPTNPGTQPDPSTEVFECGTSADAGGFEFDEIARWRGGSQAAYTLTHDDLCSWSVRGLAINAFGALDSRGLKATFGTIADTCEYEGTWGEVTDAEADGHEIANHSWDHTQIEDANAAVQISDSKDLLEQHTNNEVEFFIFPYDYFTPNTRNVATSSGHLGMRAGIRDNTNGSDNPPINGHLPDNDTEVMFDVWPRSYSKYALYSEEDMLWLHVHNAIEAGGWSVREFHSVIADADDEAENGFGPIYMTPYETHLDDLVDAWEKGALWTGSARDVIRYRHAREACDATVANDVIQFDTSNPDCTDYATHITVVVTTGNDLPSVEGEQNGLPVATRKLSANTYAITVDPTQGDVSLGGCDDDGPAVADGTVKTKPLPADSVCDLETEVGTGSPGTMDDLERDALELQILPNPSQADNRDGSWSWYPQAATVEIVDDGGNNVLNYRGQSLNAWTGTTLAFLGGNGAGTCYDASAYSGIRFRIKGNVTATDNLTGQVIVSMITAETQSQLYGGDLDGSGGHFNTIVPVTNSWQTHQFTWAQLNSPTWGDTLGLTSLAVAELQAIDWGVTNAATSFDIYLDDIELF